MRPARIAFQNQIGVAVTIYVDTEQRDFQPPVLRDEYGFPGFPNYRLAHITICSVAERFNINGKFLKLLVDCGAAAQTALAGCFRKHYIPADKYQN